MNPNSNSNSNPNPNHYISISDMRAISLGAAQKLGISVVTIDARILERYLKPNSV
jgi:hypothetical protein